jgi:hypothetical protein
MEMKASGSMQQPAKCVTPNDEEGANTRLVHGEARAGIRLWQNGTVVARSPTTGHPSLTLNTSCEVVHLYFISLPI